MITDVEVRDAGPKGKGVFALRDFKKGEFIFRRRNSKPISTAEIASLSEEDQMHQRAYLPYAPPFIVAAYKRRRHA